MADAQDEIDAAFYAEQRRETVEHGRRLAEEMGLTTLGACRKAAIFERKMARADRIRGANISAPIHWNRAAALDALADAMSAAKAVPTSCRACEAGEE